MRPLNYRPTGDQAIDDYNYRDHQQQMNQRVEDMGKEEQKSPTNEEYYRDSPEHDGILARSELRRARWQRACLSH
jgi:hypothetical protein